MTSAAELIMANAPTEETQQARLESLKGKKCIWITAPCIPGMSNQMASSAQWVMDHGVELWGCFETEEDALYKVMKERKVFDKALFADLSGEDACDNIVKAATEAGVTFDIVFSPYEHCITLIGEVAAALGLHGNPAKAYRDARSKNLTRVATAAAGLATPRSGVAKSEEELAETVERVGFPCILKPSSGAGSCGVLRADTMEEATKAFNTITADLAKNAMLKWNPGCDECAVLVEQCLIGHEFDVDCLMWDGEAKYIQVVDNWPCIAPYYLETGSQMPSRFTEEEVASLKNYAVDCVRALGFHSGCFHVEVMLTSEGPVLIEVNARQGGGPNQVFNLEMHGVNIFENYFLALAGVPINPPRKECDYAMADYAITSPFTGTLVDDKHMDAIKAHPNVYSTQDFAKVGSKVSGLDSGFPQWINQFIVKGDSPEHCAEIINSLIDGIEKRINIVEATEEPEQEAPVADEE